MSKVAASHPELDRPPLLVAPATGNSFTKVRAGIIPGACFAIEDNHFQFDSSFVFPLGQTFDADPLKKLLTKHPGSKLSIFGHADPTGKDEFNKRLSGRRAQAIFGMLVRDTDLWLDLYTHHDTTGNDPWGVKPVQIMLNMVGPTQVGAASGVVDDPTKKALADFEDGQGLPRKGFNGKNEIDPSTFKALAALYMDAVCIDDDGKPFKLAPEDFIARGAGKDGKGDFQGCGEFNPLMIFSQEERLFFDKEENHPRRNQENEVNRRVMVLLYQGGTKVDPELWPCPTVKEGTAKCLKRLFADAALRRSNLEVRREHKDEATTPDMAGTFACRFYERQVSTSPCEGLLSNAFEISLVLFTNSGSLVLANEPFKLTLSDGRTIEDKTGENGQLDVEHVPAGDHLLQVAGVEIKVPAMLRGEDPRPTRVPAATPFDAPQESSLLFRYSLQMTPGVPWSRQAKLRVVSEDGSQEQSFVLSSGGRAGNSLVFLFRRFPAGVKFKGEVVDGKTAIELFPPTDLSKMQDTSDPSNILPLLPPNQFANQPDPKGDNPPPPPSVDPAVKNAILGSEITQ